MRRMTTSKVDDFVNSVNFDQQGLVPAIAQQTGSGEVLMLAWMSEDSLRITFASGDATYYSRSRRQLWRKGETSGNTQRVVAVHLDCDGDSVLLEVDQVGPACHTGLRSCFDTRVESLDA